MVESQPWRYHYGGMLYVNDTGVVSKLLEKLWKMMAVIITEATAEITCFHRQIHRRDEGRLGVLSYTSEGMSTTIGAYAMPGIASGSTLSNYRVKPIAPLD